MTDSKKTVVFNVGGKHFEVARGTLDKYQNSMLARLASDTWDGDKDEPIFVDANSDRFNFVLDYMRHNEINVPITVSKDAVMKDLKYFCVPFEESQIKSTIRKHGYKRLGEIGAELIERNDSLNKERDYIRFAHWCMLEKSKSESTYASDFHVSFHHSDKDRPFAYKYFAGSFDEAMCKACLAEIGLKIKERVREYDVLRMIISEL